MWEFSVALYMINSWPDSLLFTAIYGVVESASIAIFGPLIGSLVDRLTYLQVNFLLISDTHEIVVIAVLLDTNRYVTVYCNRQDHS